MGLGLEGRSSGVPWLSDRCPVAVHMRIGVAGRGCSDVRAAVADVGKGRDSGHGVAGHETCGRGAVSHCCPMGCPGVCLVRIGVTWPGRSDVCGLGWDIGYGVPEGEAGDSCCPMIGAKARCAITRTVMLGTRATGRGSGANVACPKVRSHGRSEGQAAKARGYPRPCSALPDPSPRNMDLYPRGGARHGLPTGRGSSAWRTA